MRSDVSEEISPGLKVIEIGHFIAAPFCTLLLADLGADAIKNEPLDGDPVQQ
jgi:crotonobetainyl-CoA:carnitine CoA-transferase CaiB-like acyl-CoA transferase